MAMQPEVRYINAYVSGTAACQPEKKPRKKQAVCLPKVRKQQKLVIPVDMVAVGGILAAVVLSVLLLVGLTQMHQAQQEAKAQAEAEKIAERETANKSQKKLDEVKGQIMDFFVTNKSNLDVVRPVLKKCKELGYDNPSGIASLKDAKTILAMIEQ